MGFLLTASYLGVLVVLGVDARDRLVVGTLASRYRGALAAAVGDRRSRWSRDG